MNQSTITINIQLDESRVPEIITWHASDSTLNNEQKARALMLAFWDSTEKAALRIDLWTKDMMVDEMADFFYQTIMTMADTYERATKYKEIVDRMKTFAHEFYHQSREQQMKEHKA